MVALSPVVAAGRLQRCRVVLAPLEGLVVALSPVVAGGRRWSPAALS